MNPLKIVIGALAGHDHMVGADIIGTLRATHPEVVFVAPVTPDELHHEIVNAEGFIGWPDRQGLQAATRLRWIHVPGMGIDNLVTLPGIDNPELVLTNSPGTHTRPIADHVMLFVLALAHRARELMDDQRAKRWDPTRYRARMMDLDGTTMVLLGIGGIGRAVHQRAMAFGIHITAVDPSPTDVPAGVTKIVGLQDLDSVLPTADWLVVTAPLTQETHDLLNHRRLELLKPGAFVIVVSRGGIVDETALVAALQSGHVAGAGLDATATEPLPKDSPLWEMDNVFISPHASGDSPTLWAERRQIIRDQVGRFVSGQPLVFVCNKQRGY